MSAADHPYTDPSDGRQQCEVCGKYVWPVTHSCKGVRVAELDGGPSFAPSGLPAKSAVTSGEKLRIEVHELRELADLIECNDPGGTDGHAIVDQIRRRADRKEAEAKGGV